MLLQKILEARQQPETGYAYAGRDGLGERIAESGHRHSVRGTGWRDAIFSSTRTAERNR
jgi:hypothetical protein